MAGDHDEPSGIKNRRNSDSDSEQPSKRHRRHHHRRHRHRRSRNHPEKDSENDAEIEEKAESPVKIGPVDDEVEEGEILEEDEEFVAEKRQLESSDVESGEIKGFDADRDQEAFQVELGGSTCEGQNIEKVGSRLMMLGVDEVAVGDGDDVALSRKRIINGDTKMCDGIDVQRDSSVERYGNIDISKDRYSKSSQSSSPEGLGKRKGYYIGDSERRRQKIFSSVNEGDRNISMGRSALPGRFREEDRPSSRSRSPERPKEKLQSQSVVGEPSRLRVQQFNAASKGGNRLPKNSDDETISRYDNEYWHGSRDWGERDRSSTNRRRTTREERYQSSDSQTRFRGKSREILDRERERRDRPREKDWEKVQERGRERDRNQESERVNERERRRERERDSDRRDWDQDIIKEKEYDKYTGYRKHSDANTGYADRDYTNDRHRRTDGTDNWDKAKRSDAGSFQSSKIYNTDVDRDVEKESRDELEQENFQENTVLQPAEKEEEEIDRIKEESRKRKQAILEKFKKQQNPEAKMEINAKTSLSDEETQSAQDEAAGTLHEKLFSVEKSPEQLVPPAVKVAGSGALGGGTPKSEGSDDMFRDDIFGDSPAGVRKSEKGDCLPVKSSGTGANDNWDDAEGYYSYRIGEVLDGRYEVIAAHGKGVFSSVVRAKDLNAGFGDPEEVAIKIIRNNDIMLKAGLEELVILKKLVAADKEDKRHCVRLISSFKFRSHLCLVFESLHMNLREVLKKFGRNIGLKLTAVRTYAKQLFIALKHLRNCGVLHCDIKPDNMLVNDAKNVLKLCDFGNAMFAGKNEVTPYLVSRFYRAPEIILGLQYDHPMDIWSVGCCLYEIYTGKVLFPGPSNNDMLRLHMELKGPFSKKMLRKGAFVDNHFDQDLNFLATEEDPVTKKVITRLVPNIKPKDIGSIVFGSAGDDPKMLSNFKDLLEKIFALDPDKRITVSQALGHPFITGK